MFVCVCVFSVARSLCSPFSVPFPLSFPFLPFHPCYFIIIIFIHAMEKGCVSVHPQRVCVCATNIKKKSLWIKRGAREGCHWTVRNHSFLYVIRLSPLPPRILALFVLRSSKTSFSLSSLLSTPTTKTPNAREASHQKSRYCTLLWIYRTSDISRPSFCSRSPARIHNNNNRQTYNNKESRQTGSMAMPPTPPRPFDWNEKTQKSQKINKVRVCRSKNGRRDFWFLIFSSPLLLTAPGGKRDKRDARGTREEEQEEEKQRRRRGGRRGEGREEEGMVERDEVGSSDSWILWDYCTLPRSSSMSIISHTYTIA